MEGCRLLFVFHHSIYLVHKGIARSLGNRYVTKVEILSTAHPTQTLQVSCE
jgi:hypothetical protein